MAWGYSDQPARSAHVIVFDVNVWVDVASVLGRPFSWDEFDDQARATSSWPVPYPDVRVDSLRSLANSRSGQFAPGQPLHIGTCWWIDHLVANKLVSRLRWSEAQAAAFVTDCIHDLVQQTDGAYLDQVVAQAIPPLDHDDGTVYAAAKTMPCASPEVSRYLVTRDGPFHRQAPIGDVTTVFASDWIKLVRRSRAASRRASSNHTSTTPKPGPPLPQED